MKLNLAELKWIDDQINLYDIRYQEVYDELIDHFVTSIDLMREKGDERNVQELFQEVLDTQFPGYYSLERISIAYAAAYKARLKKAIRKNYKLYFNWKTIPLIILVLIAGYYIPQNGAAFFVMMAVSFLGTAVPFAYIWYYTSKIKTDDGKKSLLRNYMMNEAYAFVFSTMIIFQTTCYIVKHGGHMELFKPNEFSPLVSICFLVFFIIYSLSALNQCKQELKIVD